MNRVTFDRFSRPTPSPLWVGANASVCMGVDKAYMDAVRIFETTTPGGMKRIAAAIENAYAAPREFAA